MVSITWFININRESVRVEVKSEVYNKVAKSIVQTAGARESCWPCPDNRECPENITAGLRKSWPAEPTKDWYEGKVFQGGCITLHGAARQVPFTSVGVYCRWLAQLCCRSEPFFIWNSIVLICIVVMSKPIPHTSGIHLKGESHLQFWVTFLSLQPGQEYRFYMIWVLHFLPNISAFPEKKVIGNLWGLYHQQASVPTTSALGSSKVFSPNSSQQWSCREQTCQTHVGLVAER